MSSSSTFSAPKPILPKPCAFCETTLDPKKCMTSGTEEEIVQLEDIAVDNFKRHVLRTEDVSLLLEGELGQSRYRKIFDSIKLCSDCIVHFARREQVILKDQLSYLEKLSKVTTLEAAFRDPFLEIKRLAFHNLKSDKPTLKAKLAVIEKLLSDEKGDLIDPGIVPRSSSVSNTTTVEQADSSSDKLPVPPPTPHKIQIVDEQGLCPNESYVITTTSKNSCSNHVPVKNAAKPISSEKAEKSPPGEERHALLKKLKHLDQRRSNRKTQEVINSERHQLLIQAILDGQQDGLTAKPIPGKGRGVVSTKRFLRHEFVVEYAGDLLTAAEARTREAEYAKDTGAGCYTFYFEYNNQQYCVDATKETDRLGRLINHSRSGNLVTKVVEVKGTPRLILIAKKDIEIDEEICFDYGDRRREALRHHPWLAY